MNSLVNNSSSLNISEDQNVIINGDIDFISKNNIESYNFISKKLSMPKTTRPKLTKYEETRAIGYRAEQIACGMNVFVEVESNDSPIVIATKELKQKKLPYIIKRPLPDGTNEYWKINDLIN